MDEEKSPKIKNRRVHLANERTFLAWIRTSISIMAFGFVMERFSIFLTQFSCFLTRGEMNGVAPKHHSYTVSSVLGIVLIGFGALIGVLALIRYKKIEKQIDDDTYKPSFVMDALLALCILVVGLFFVMYFLHTTALLN
ncbi:MAG: YidH family protein [Thermodesulforhabdaceae bacterium]|jgi:putative membrane protein